MIQPDLAARVLVCKPKQLLIMWDSTALVATLGLDVTYEKRDKCLLEEHYET